MITGLLALFNIPLTCEKWALPKITCKDPRISPVSETCFLAPPLAAVWQALTFAANLREQRLSCRDSASGLTFTNISVLPSPPKQGCIKQHGITLILLYENALQVLRKYCSLQLPNPLKEGESRRWKEPSERQWQHCHAYSKTLNYRRTRPQAADLEQMSQLWVAMRNVWVLGGKSSEHISQCTETFVDAACLFLPLAFCLRSVQPFAARKQSILMHFC